MRRICGTRMTASASTKAAAYIPTRELSCTACSRLAAQPIDRPVQTAYPVNPAAPSSGHPPGTIGQRATSATSATSANAIPAPISWDLAP